MALTDNLVAAYKLSDTSDYSGNGNNLTNNGTVVFNAGLIGNAADFGAPNTTKYLSLASGFGIGTGDFSISWWFKNAGTDHDFDGMVALGTGSYHIKFIRNGNNNRWWIQADGGGDGLFTESISNSTWYHLCAVNSAGTITLYVNTVSKCSTSSPGTNSNATLNI
jgi:hypothetical protein